MYVACVHIHVKEEYREQFIEATLENARSAIHEPANLRFDVNQQTDDPNRFVIYEVYKDAGGVTAHKQTPHYAKWRETVASWMAEDRRGVIYNGLFPETEDKWVVES